MSIVSHNTDRMRDWSSAVDSKAGDYDSLIDRLYNLVEGFAGSANFKGGLSTDLLSNMTELYSLYISDNKLENIKFGNNPNLQIAQCLKNNLKNF